MTKIINTIKSKAFISIILVAVLLTLGFIKAQNTASSALSKLSPSERASKTQNNVESLSKNPNGESTVLVSFSEFQNEEFVKSSIKDNNLSINQLYHAFKAPKSTFRGGYLKQGSESVEEAFNKYRAQILTGAENSINFLRQEISRQESNLPTGQDEKSETERKYFDAMKALLSDYEALASDVKSRGLKFYGMQIKAKNSDILRLMNTGKVRALELIENESAKNAIPILPNE